MILCLNGGKSLKAVMAAKGGINIFAMLSTYEMFSKTRTSVRSGTNVE